MKSLGNGKASAAQISAAQIIATPITATPITATPITATPIEPATLLENSERQSTLDRKSTRLNSSH